MMKDLITPALAAGFTAALLACGDAQPADAPPASELAAEAPEYPKVERSEDGLTVINRGDDLPDDLAFREVATIGGMTDERVQWTAIRPSDLALVDDYLVVLDRAGFRVDIFDRSGERTHAFGSQGGGPGELIQPAHVAGMGGAVGVYDAGRLGIARFTLDGRYDGVREVDHPPGSDGFAVLDDALVLVEAVGHREPGDSVRDELVRITPDAEREVIVSLRKVRPRHHQYTGCVGIALDPVFSPSVVWTALDGRIGGAAGTPYAIEIRSEGERRTIMREVEPRAVDESDAAAELRDLSVGTPAMSGPWGSVPASRCTITAEEQAEVRGFEPELQSVRALVFRPGGELWVKRGHLTGEEPLIDRFDAEGSYLGTRTGGPFPAVFLSRDTFAAIDQDEMEVPIVRIFLVE
jgi:hypothetical protein